MRKIAVMNQKGGVGKTTTAVNLSAALARSGSRVCLVDLDPQAHASLHFPHDQQPAATIYEVLSGKASLGDACRQVSENLTLVPSSLDLAAAEVELAGVAGREVILREKLRETPPQAEFLVVDCPPSLGILTLNALAAADEVLIPLQPHFLALHGLSRLLETVELVAASINDRLALCGVVLCMYDPSTRLAVEVSNDVEEFFRNSQGRPGPWSGARVFQTRIRRNIHRAEAPSFGQSIFQYAPHSNGAEDYASLAAEIHADPS
jgi:chromosome partitioning protein